MHPLGRGGAAPGRSVHEPIGLNDSRSAAAGDRAAEVLTFLARLRRGTPARPVHSSFESLAAERSAIRTPQIRPRPRGGAIRPGSSTPRARHPDQCDVLSGRSARPRDRPGGRDRRHLDQATYTANMTIAAVDEILASADRRRYSSSATTVRAPNSTRASRSNRTSSNARATSSPSTAPATPACSHQPRRPSTSFRASSTPTWARPFPSRPTRHSPGAIPGSTRSRSIQGIRSSGDDAYAGVRGRHCPRSGCGGQPAPAGAATPTGRPLWPSLDPLPFRSPTSSPSGRPRIIELAGPTAVVTSCRSSDRSPSAYSAIAIGVACCVA